MNHLKSVETSLNYFNCFTYDIFILKNFEKVFVIYKNGKLKYKNKNIKTEYLNTWYDQKGMID